MKLGEFNVFDAINTLGTQWVSMHYTEEVSVNEKTGFGTDEKVIGFVVFVYIYKDNEMDILLFDKTCVKPKYKLRNNIGMTLLVFEFND